VPPYVQAALICEKVLIEKDESFSIIRAIDRLHASGEPSEANPLIFGAHLMLCVRHGDGEAQPSVRVQVDILGPSGRRTHAIDRTVPMDPFGGVNINTLMALQFVALGVYRFVVLLDGVESIRLSLNVTSTPAPGGPIVVEPLNADGGSSTR